MKLYEIIDKTDLYSDAEIICEDNENITLIVKKKSKEKTADNTPHGPKETDGLEYCFEDGM